MLLVTGASFSGVIVIVRVEVLESTVPSLMVMLTVRVAVDGSSSVFA